MKFLLSGLVFGTLYRKLYTIFGALPQLVLVFSIILMFLIRLIEFSSSIFIFTRKIKGKKCFDSSKVCTNYTQFGSSFYLVSCCLTLFQFYFLNKEFRSKMQQNSKKVTGLIKVAINQIGKWEK